MFRLLSKEASIFSAPLYIGFLLLMVLGFNLLNFSYENTLSAVITFAGIALGYFIFNQINLTYQTHLPLFLYTFLVFAFYPGDLDIGLAVALLTNSFLLLIITSPEEAVRKRGYLLVGAILAVNFIVLPTTWPMFIFAVLHVVATAQRIALNIFRLIFGMVLIFCAYFCLMFFLHYWTFDDAYLPIPSRSFLTAYYPLYFLLPVLMLIIWAVADHFKHYNEKSPVSRYKYSFILIFSIAQLITIVLYMGRHFEYLLLLAFPASIILSRLLHFMPRFWMMEAGLWLITLSLIGFKAGTFFNFT